jgi:hypothetical protein
MYSFNYRQPLATWYESFVSDHVVQSPPSRSPLNVLVVKKLHWWALALSCSSGCSLQAPNCRHAKLMVDEPMQYGTRVGSWETRLTAEYA